MIRFIYLGFNIAFNTVLGHITTGSFVAKENQYIQLVKVVYCKLPTISKLLQTFPHKIWGLNRRPQRWEVSVITASLWPQFDLETEYRVVKWVIEKVFKYSLTTNRPLE